MMRSQRREHSCRAPWASLFSRRRWAWSLAATCSVAGVAGSAWADCAAPVPEVLWSQPAAGAVDVPTDADLFLTPSVAPEAVRLNGQELTPATEFPGHYELGELEPNTTYSVVVELPPPFVYVPPDTQDAGAEREGEDVEWSFTTGAEPAAEQPLEFASPTLTIVPSELYDESPIWQAISAVCQEALLVNTCYDTGVPALITIESPPGAALYVLESFAPALGQRSFRSVPGDCALAMNYVWSEEGWQHTAHAITQNGTVWTSPTQEDRGSASRVGDVEASSASPEGVDEVEAEEQRAAPREAGCSVTPQAEPRGAFGWELLWALAPLGIALRLRRSRRRRACQDG